METIARNRPNNKIRPSGESGPIRIVVLGNMQDAGLPHVGCRCSRCLEAYQGERSQQHAASLGIIDSRQKPAAVWLVDATPDITYQLNYLANELGPHPTKRNRLQQPDGIFLTHAHMGHTAGLAQFGPEGMNVEALPIYAFPELLDVISETKLWSPLINNLQLVPIQPNNRQWLAPDLSIRPIPVPHRDELGCGTAAFRIEGPNKSLFYVPDIDNWTSWQQSEKELEDLDFLLADGTFFSDDELDGLPRVAHPVIPETLEAFAEKPFQLVLTHFNHTNPILDENSSARTLVETNGAIIAQTGQWFNL